MTYADDNAVIRTKVNGVDMDVRISDARKTLQLQSAAEQNFARAQQMKQAYAEQIRFGEQLLPLKNNPEAMARKLAELTGAQLGVVTPSVEDDGSDPATKQLRDKVAQLEQQNAVFTQYLAENQSKSELQALHEAVKSLPLYQDDDEALNRAKVSVVAMWLKDGKQRPLTEIAGEVHAADAAWLQRQLQGKFDQRTATAAQLATIPPGSGTPGLSENSSYKSDPKAIQSGGWRKPFDAFVARIGVQ